MCWSEQASLAMVGVGTVAAVVTARRGDPWAIPATLAFFAVMEGLQWIGYQQIDQCDVASNRYSAMLSWAHISLQPIFINLFGMALVGGVSARMRRWVIGLAALSSALLLSRMIPMDWAGMCRFGVGLCGPEWCTRTGSWHIGWTMPLNDLFGTLSGGIFDRWTAFPDYLLAAFVLPLVYGAWRFVLVHATLGPILATFLAGESYEMAAIWCLFSVGLALIALSPVVRRTVAPPREAPAE